MDNKHIGQKRFLIYGYSEKTFKAILNAAQRVAEYIVDENPDLWNGEIGGVPIHSPYVLNQEKNKDNVTIFICVDNKEILRVERMLHNKGFIHTYPATFLNQAIPQVIHQQVNDLIPLLYDEESVNILKKLHKSAQIKKYHILIL